MTLSNCGETESQESCAQDEICTDKSVTSCCTDGTCVFKYNGKEYTEDQLAELADDLGCNDGGARIAAEGNEQVIFNLQALMAKAKAGLR